MLDNFKRQLNCVFDDDLHTKVWHNILDWVIISLILISSLAIFLSTFDGITEKIGGILHFIDIFTTIVFTVEVSLRIWAADLLDPKYKGFWGRVRYCFSFYGLLDFLSTYTFYIGMFVTLPVTALKIFRVARLFRVFRYLKSFRILGRAIESKKYELTISLLFLSTLTVILSFLLYYAEHQAQPELCGDAWDTLVWAFAKYLGDPGKIADFPIMTPWGHFIAAIVGILGIAIFAVPAGLISSGFLEVIEEDRHQEDLAKNIEKLYNAFERKQDSFTLCQIAPQFLSVTEIQARMRMTEDSIFEAIDECDRFRVINVGCTIPLGKTPHDRLAIEHFQVNRPYGCMIDRGSKVTIVSPSNVVDPAIGHFSYYLAKFGGFNYVSRELGQTRPYKSFYTYMENDLTEERLAFMNDIEKLSGNGGWVITALAASGMNEREFPTQIHFGYGGDRGEESFDVKDMLIHDIPLADSVMRGIEETVESEFDLKCDRQRYHKTSHANLFVRHLANRDQVNGLVIRFAWSVICHDPRKMAVAKSVADVIRSTIEPEHSCTEWDELKTKALGYDGYKN